MYFVDSHSVDVIRIWLIVDIQRSGPSFKNDIINVFLMYFSSFLLSNSSLFLRVALLEKLYIGLRRFVEYVLKHIFIKFLKSNKYSMKIYFFRFKDTQLQDDGSR